MVIMAMHFDCASEPKNIRLQLKTDNVSSETQTFDGQKTYKDFYSLGPHFTGLQTHFQDYSVQRPDLLGLGHGSGPLP